MDHPEYGPIARKLGVDATISPHRAVADAILHFARRSAITATTTLGNHQGEVIEFHIDKKGGKKLIGTPVGELKFPKNATIGIIVRRGEVIVPNPEQTELEPDDDVFVVALRDAIPKLEALFD